MKLKDIKRNVVLAGLSAVLLATPSCSTISSSRQPSITTERKGGEYLNMLSGDPKVIYDRYLTPKERELVDKAIEQIYSNLIISTFAQP